MTDEQKAAFIVAQSACLVATVLGMHAENMKRQSRGESMAYDQESFSDVIDRSPCHHNAVLSLFQE